MVKAFEPGAHNAFLLASCDIRLRAKESSWRIVEIYLTRCVKALQTISEMLSFDVLGIDSDNGSEFVNHHLWGYCEERGIQFTRSRPYRKDDNAHIEQKNWTHVKKFMGWDRYDFPPALQAINRLYENELSVFMDLFQPSVKLVRTIHTGSGKNGSMMSHGPPWIELLPLGISMTKEPYNSRRSDKSWIPFACLSG